MLFSHLQVYREVRIMKLVDHPNIGELLLSHCQDVACHSRESIDHVTCVIPCLQKSHRAHCCQVQPNGRKLKVLHFVEIARLWSLVFKKINFWYEERRHITFARSIRCMAGKKLSGYQPLAKHMAAPFGG